MRNSKQWRWAVVDLRFYLSIGRAGATLVNNTGIGKQTRNKEETGHEIPADRIDRTKTKA